MRLTDYFERTFIVNLPERSDRRREMLTQLKQIGLSIEPNKLEFFPAIRPADPAGFACVGTHGCYLSHLTLLKRAKEEGWRNLLLMEDDLSFSPRFPEDESSLMEQLQNSHWGFAYFGNKIHAMGKESVRWEPVTCPLSGTHFYAVNGWVLDRLISFLEEVRQRPLGDPLGGSIPIDGALSTFRERNPDVLTLLAFPNLGQQRSSRSDITPKWFDGVPILRQFIGLARRGKVWVRGR